MLASLVKYKMAVAVSVVVVGASIFAVWVRGVVADRDALEGALARETVLRAEAVAEYQAAERDRDAVLAALARAEEAKVRLIQRRADLMEELRHAPADDAGRRATVGRVLDGLYDDERSGGEPGSSGTP